MTDKWSQLRRMHPDYIGNNPGVEKCKGVFIRNINGKTKRFFCQLRYDHDKECINFSGRKTWAKGKKEIKWTQLEMVVQKNPGKLNMHETVVGYLQRQDIDTGQAILDNALNLLSQQE